MRVITSGELKYTCRFCKSVIGLFAHEICHVGPDPEEPDERDIISKSYWTCPACHKQNWTIRKDDWYGS